ncbi:hypothetical protein MTP99_006389 [Tenebrio molitor]|jgi:hypothetical protein|nr:hypothetical protein MTP99_006389 [Tenebrio molitor]
MAAKNLTKIPSRLGASLRRFFSKKEDSSSFWSYFTGKKTEDKPPAEQCRKRQGEVITSSTTRDARDVATRPPSTTHI